MAFGKREDRFANIASARVEESAPNTLTYQEILTGVSLGSGVGLLVDSVQYAPQQSTIQQLIAALDSITMGWTTSSAASLILSDRRVIDVLMLYSEPPLGTPASGASPIEMPIKHEFTPPIIVATPRLYLGVMGNSLTGVAYVDSRMLFRYQPLTPQEYLELAESTLLVG